MGDFREQLLRAGLVTAEAAEAASRQAEVSAGPNEARGGRGGRDQGGRGGSDRSGRGRSGRAESGRPRRGDTRPLDEAAALQRERDRIALGPAARLTALREAAEVARRGRLDPRGHGPVRWYFNGRSGALSWVDVTDELARRLADGRAAIAEAPSGQPFTVDQDSAARLEVLDARWLRVWNRRA